MINFNLKTQLSWRDLAVRAAFVIVTVAAIVWFMPRDARFSFKVEKGTPWRYSDLTAMFDFPVYKSDSMLTHEREEALKDFKPYYTLQDDISRRQRAAFRQRCSSLKNMPSNSFKIIISNRLSDIYERGIVDTKEPLGNDTTQTFWRVDGENATSVSITQVLTARQAYELLMQDSTVRLYSDVLQELDLNQFLVPNLVYDSVHSQSAREDIIRSVAPSSKVVQRGQKIISRGDIVDEDAYQVLMSYEQENEQRHNSRETGLTLLGKIL